VITLIIRSFWLYGVVGVGTRSYTNMGEHSHYSTWFISARKINTALYYG
jgi:hypothetical protein